MDANGIIGREYEQKLILERCKSNKAELIAIYGRRRVGKTFLVRKMFNDQFAFSFIGMYEVSVRYSWSSFGWRWRSMLSRPCPS